jgi:hypothetical protein
MRDDRNIIKVGWVEIELNNVNLVSGPGNVESAKLTFPTVRAWAFSVRSFASSFCFLLLDSRPIILRFAVALRLRLAGAGVSCEILALV